MSLPTPPSTPSLASPLDMDELTIRLGELLNNYRNALWVVSRLPRIGRHPTEIIRRSAEHEQVILPGRPSQRWVVRSFVRFFVELHIRRKLKTILNLLKVEEMSLDVATPEFKTIRAYTKQLKLLHGTMSGRGWLSSFLTKVPLLSVFAPLVTALVLQLSGVNISNASALGTALGKLAQSDNWRALPRFLFVLGLLLVYLYVILVPFVVGIGFRGKRAIFQGGETVKDIFDWDPIIAEYERWVSMPDANIYQSENQVFDTLRIAKPREFPLDLLSRFTVYFSLVVAVWSTLESVQSVKQTGTFSKGMLLIPLFWFLVIYFLFAGRKNYLRRVKAGNM